MKVVGNSRVTTKQRREMTEVVIVDEQIGADSRRIWATFDAGGNPVISGQTIGSKVERFLGTNEYESGHMVPVEHMSSFLALLGVEDFENSLDVIKKFSGSEYNKIADALEMAKKFMPIKFSSRN